MAIFVEANPARDLDALDVVQLGSAGYLATLEQRSSEMAQTDTKPTTSEPAKRIWTPWLVAAVLIFVVGVAVIIFNQSEEDLASPTTVLEVTPTTSPEVAPTTAPEPPPTTLPAVVDEWEQIPALVLAGAAGEYRTAEFAVPFSITLPDGWADAEDEFDQVELSPTAYFCTGDPGLTDEEVERCRGTVSITLFRGGVIDEMIRAISEAEGIADLEPTDMEIGGVPATWIAPKSMSDQPLLVQFHEEGDIGIWPGDEFRLYFVDVNGEILLVEVRDQEEGAFYDEFQPILDSIVWKDVG